MVLQIYSQLRPIQYTGYQTESLVFADVAADAAIPDGCSLT